MSRARGLTLALRYGAITLLLTFALLPVYAAILGSLTPSAELGNQAIFPRTFYWQNWVIVWQRIPLLAHLRASMVYAVGSSLVAVGLAAMAAFALSRFRFTGKQFYLYFLLVSQVVPLIIVAIPLFILMNKLGLYDTYIAVILAVSALSLPFPIFLLRSYFDGLPVELEEAAMVDGCTRFGSLVRVVLPLSAPGLLTAFALVFFSAWQQFLVPLVLTNSPDKVPVTVGIFRLMGAYEIPWELIMAGALIASIPPILVYLLAQRFLIQGMLSGSIK